MKKILLIADRRAFDAFRQSKLQEHGSGLKYAQYGTPVKLIIPDVEEYIWFEKLNHQNFMGWSFDSILVLSDQVDLLEKLENILVRVRSSESYFKALKTIHDEQEALRKKQVKRLVNLSKPKKELKTTKKRNGKKDKNI